MDKPRPKQSKATPLVNGQTSESINKASTSKPVKQVNQGASNNDAPLPHLISLIKRRFSKRPIPHFALGRLHHCNRSLPCSHESPSLNLNPKPPQSVDLIVQPLDMTSVQILQSIDVLGNGKRPFKTFQPIPKG